MKQGTLPKHLVTYEVFHNSLQCRYCFSFNFIVSWLGMAAGRRHTLNSILLQTNSDKRESPIQEFILRYIPCKSVFLKHNLWYGQVHYWFDTGVVLELQSPLWGKLAAAGCVRGNINTNRNKHFKDISKLIIPGIHFCLGHQKMIYLLRSKHRINP